MTASETGAGVAGSVRALAASTARELARSGARDEALAVFEAERRRLGILRPARMRPAGRVWRLGALLLDMQGRLYATGKVVRAQTPARRSVVTLSAAEHREYQAAAMRGGYASGETVDFDATPVDPEALAVDGGCGPLVVRDATVLVRWSPGRPEALTELSAYLADRAALLLRPPEGA